MISRRLSRRKRAETARKARENKALQKPPLNRTVRQLDGGFAVVEGRPVIAGPFATNSEAWRWIDRAERSPISRAESVSNFIWSKMTESAR